MTNTATFREGSREEMGPGAQVETGYEGGPEGRKELVSVFEAASPAVCFAKWHLAKSIPRPQRFGKCCIYHLACDSENI